MAVVVMVVAHIKATKQWARRPSHFQGRRGGKEMDKYAIGQKPETCLLGRSSVQGGSNSNVTVVKDSIRMGRNVVLSLGGKKHH